MLGLAYTVAMLMVIFGAGASYDSAQAYRPVYPGGGSYGANFSAPSPARDEPWRPPLAKDLFLDKHHELGSIVGRYPKLTHILPYLREPSGGRSVEQMLESLQEEGKDNPESKKELASVQFYLCDLFRRVTDEWSTRTDGVTNYAALIRDILRFNTGGDRICLVTFNYDLLLERALYTFGFKRNDPEVHLDSHPLLKLFKLHGSVDWSRVVELPEGTRLLPQHLIEQADTIQLSDKFVLANPTNPHEMDKFGKPIFPAIAIPVQTKSDRYFQCPAVHLTYFSEMLKYVTKILIIGWQAREEHFLRLLVRKIPRLQNVMVVGANSSDAQTTSRYFMESICMSVPPVDTLVGHGGFTDFIVNSEGNSFFKER